MQHRRNNCNCNLCPLNGCNKVFSQRPEVCGKIAILAEAPGSAEEESGIPLIGPSGRIFNLALARVGLNRDNLWLANTTLCRPPENDIQSPEGRKAISCCRNGLMEELRQMHKAGIRVVGAMGQTAADALGCEGSISKIRGSVYAHKPTGMHIIPMLHPAAVLRGGGGRKQTGGIGLLAGFMSDLTKLKEISSSGWKPLREIFNITPTAQDVEDFVDKAIKQKQLLALDIETTGLSARRGARPVVIGLAPDAEHAIVIPLLKEHGLPYWQNGDAHRVDQALQRLFSSKEVNYLLQNCFFDLPFLRQHKYDISIDCVYADTMVLHSLISPETKHDLGYIVSTFGQTPEWKEDFKHREKSILEMDQLKMRTYNARDCVVLHQVSPPMLKELAEEGLTAFYEEETKPLMKPFMQMQEAGVGFDVGHMNKFRQLLMELVEQKKAELLNAYRLPMSFSLDNPDEIRWLLFGQTPTKASRLRSTLVTYEKELKSGKKKATKLFYGLLPVEIKASELPDNVLQIEEVPTTAHKKAGTAIAQELREIEALLQIKPLYSLKAYRGQKTDGDKQQISRDALLAYRIALQNRLSVIEDLQHPEAKRQEVDDIEDSLNFMEQYNEYKEKQKLVTTFTKYGADPDSRVRPSWLMHGTATGRLSVKQPNLAQLPARGEGKEVRQFFIAPPGWKIIDADYENAEVALLGYETNDPIIIDIYESGRNIHDENTKLLFHLNAEDDLWAEGRRAAKVFQFGGLSYGGGDREIHKKILLAAPKLRLTLHDYVVAKEEWMHMHPAYVSWKSAVVAEVTATRKLKNAFGRERIFLGHPRDIIKEGMNFKIQSLGACLINRAMIRIYDRLQSAGARTRQIMQVYDEIVLESPDDEVVMAKQVLVEEMTRPFQMHGRMCSIRAEATEGQNYGEAK